MPHSTHHSLETLSSFSDSSSSFTAHAVFNRVPHASNRSRAAQRISSTAGLSPVSSVDSLPRRSSRRNTAIQTVMPERNTVNYSADNEAGKRRSQYYEEAFAYKENGSAGISSARERVHREAPVVAELRTNVIIKDEFTLVTDLSYHLAARYSRPDTSIMINVDHSSCLALAGTFEPCYILTISTVPSEMQPTTNKRNAALIQSFMADILSVPPDRGIIKFNPIPEENLATNGNTMLGEVERLERLQASGGGGGGGDGAMKRSTAEARKSMPSFAHKKPSTTSAPRLSGAMPNGNGNATHERKHERRRSNSASVSPPLLSPSFGNVFELSSDPVQARPSTSHGASQTSTSKANSQHTFSMQNGLRLNGISKEELVGPSTRTSNGRPKTFSGRPMTADYNPSPLPNQPSASSRRKSAVPSPSTSSFPSRSLSKTSPLPKSLRPAIREQESDADDSTYEGAVAAARKADADATANTAKRRSTITATPRMPLQQIQEYAVPPVPETKPARVGKRKSFLAAFRR